MIDDDDDDKSGRECEQWNCRPIILGMLKTDNNIHYPDIRLPVIKLSGYQYGFVSGLMILLKWDWVKSSHKHL